MSTTASRGFLDTSRRSYVAAVPFNNDIYNYVQTPLANGLVVGRLVPLVGANPQNCPAGRVLRETSRKLYPNEATPGITTPMVAVYDEQTFFTGFIDPNSPNFAVYSTDTSYFFKTGVNPATGLTDVGPPVFTYGAVATTGPITSHVNYPILYNPGFVQVPYNNTPRYKYLIMIHVCRRALEARLHRLVLPLRRAAYIVLYHYEYLARMRCAPQIPPAS